MQPSSRTRAALVACASLAGAGFAATTVGASGPDAGDAQAAAPRVTTVARGLDIPWEIAFLPDGRALVTERPGRVRLLTRGGDLRGQPAARVAVSARGEGGLLGLAVDPRFERNRFVYLYYTTARGMRVARYRMRGDRLRRDRVILGGIAAGEIHDSGRIHFGPDGKLYIATGDAGVPDLSQRPGSRNGKFLRMAPRSFRGRGGRAEIVSRGHRNPQGFDWQPGTRRLVSTEHGPEGFDEINVIRKGANFGWPIVSGRDHGDFRRPIALYNPSIAPSGSTFVSRRGRAWSGDYLVASLRGEQLRRLVISRTGRVVRQRVHFRNRFGRLRAVTQAPDGSLYLLTSNRDGRGSPTGADDRILRVVPPGR
jgi:glucose/arabinose dehydrogenase